MNCDDSLIVRYADNASALTPDERLQIESHLEACDACRVAFDHQRTVMAMLRDRMETTPAPGLVARVSARIDRDLEGGWLGLANWRAWTVGLAPLAAALMIVAYLVADVTTTNTAQTTAATFDEWTIGTSGSSPASALLHSAPTGDALIEAVLTGTAPSSGSSHGR